MTQVACALGPDSAGTVLTRLLRSARWSVDGAVYEVGPSYRWMLVAAARRGVRVRLVLDAHRSDGNAATARDLNAAGGECRVAGMGRSIAHGKLVVVDDACVAVGTGNLIWRDAPRDRRLRVPPASSPLAGTREWWVIVRGARSVRGAARAEMDRLWRTSVRPPPEWDTAPQMTAPPVGTPMPQVAPVVGRVASRRLRLVTGGDAIAGVSRAMISRASRRVLVTAPYVHAGTPAVRRLLDAMSAAASRGAECRLLLGTAPSREDRARLAVLPFDVRHMDPERSTSGHAKGIVADATVLVSSSNWSAAGLGANWEAALHIDHPGPSAYYAAAWRRDWATALSLAV